jgi:hypothetical protein
LNHQGLFAPPPPTYCRVCNAWKPGEMFGAKYAARLCKACNAAACRRSRRRKRMAAEEAKAIAEEEAEEAAAPAARGVAGNGRGKSRGRVFVGAADQAAAAAGTAGNGKGRASPGARAELPRPRQQHM